MNVRVYGRSGGGDHWLRGPIGHTATFGVRTVPMIGSRRRVFAEGRLPMLDRVPCV